MRAATSDSAMDRERLLALFAAKDLEALIDTAFHMLGSAVKCDFASAFYRSTGDGLFKQRDSRGREYRPALMRRYMELTLALHIAMANRGIKILPTSIGLRRQRRLVHPRVPGLTASITMICPNAGSLAEPTFVLEFDRQVHGLPLETPDRSGPVLEKLTASERAVALVVADGFSNQEIAERLGKSVHAAKFLLHRIYQKTGLPSRAALVAVLRPRRRLRTGDF